MAEKNGFFLGANTPGGFYSLYSQELRGYGTVYILKGGPGCGKSTFMGRAAHILEEEGVSCERIFCSSDPDSLDCVLFPSLNAAIVDGTAPHTWEPRYALAGDYYVDLGEYCDTAATARNRQEIAVLTDGYREHFAKAYRLLRAAGELRQVRLDTASGAGSGLERRAKGIIRKELKGSRRGKRGVRTVRFLSSVCHSGIDSRYAEAARLCPRLYEIRSDFGLGRPLIKTLAETAEDGGWDVTVCPSPMDPCGQAEHLLIPGLGLGFISAEGKEPLPCETVRTVSADRSLQPKPSPAVRAELRSYKIREQDILQLAVRSLRTAFELHSELEALYIPHMDFEAVKERAERTALKLLDSPLTPV